MKVSCITIKGAHSAALLIPPQLVPRKMALPLLRGRNHTSVHTETRKQRGVDVHIVLHGLDPQLICAARSPLQSAVPPQCALSGKYTLTKTRRELT